MSEDTRPVSVQILEKEYLVSCPQDESAALLESAHYLDKRMREIRDSGKVIGLDRIAVMAALNITHEMLQHREEKEHQSHSFNERVRILQEKIDDALAKCEKWPRGYEDETV